MSPKALKDAIRQKAGELGFELVGMVPVQPSKTHEIYKAWLEKGYAGEMAYLERHLPLKQDPRNLLPEALSLVALAFNYYTGDHPESDGSKGKISRYAWSEDYHQIMHERLKQLSDFILVELGLGTKSRGLVDSGPILEREYAWRAGLGWFGKHSNLIHWKKGSWFFLTELLIDLPLEADQPFTRVDCGTCTRCIEACPTEAIVADREVDSRLCISYLTIELKGSIPRNLRPKMGNWIFGCDICQDVIGFVCCNLSQAPGGVGAYQGFLVKEPLFQCWNCLWISPIAECDCYVPQKTSPFGAEHGAVLKAFPEF